MLSGAVRGFAFTLKHEMHVWQGLSQMSSQLTPLPASFIKASSLTPRWFFCLFIFVFAFNGPMAVLAGSSGWYWGTQTQLPTGR